MRWPLTDPKSRSFSGITAFLLHSRMIRDVAWLRPGPFDVVNKFFPPSDSSKQTHIMSGSAASVCSKMHYVFLIWKRIQSIQFGRGWIVCEGAKILEQEPYVAVLEAGAQNKRCDRCYTKSSNLKRCSACKSVFYCCADCQVITSVVPVPLGVLGFRATLQSLRNFCNLVFLKLSGDGFYCQTEWWSENFEVDHHLSELVHFNSTLINNLAMA